MGRQTHLLFLTFTCFLSFLSLISSKYLQEANIIPQGVPSQLRYNVETMIIQPSQLSLQSKMGQDYIFEDVGLSSNLLVTSKYALVGQNNEVQPTLKKLIFATMKLQTIKYPPVEGWSTIYPAILRDLQNGDIAYGEGSNLFILNNQTLEIKQIFFERSDMGNILSYINPKTNESKYIFGRGSGSYLMQEYKKNPSGKYESQYRFITPSSNSGRYNQNMVLTGKNSAAYVSGCSISYWTNLNSIVRLSRDQKDYMIKRQKVAVSYDETFFVARNDSGFYEFYTFDDKYETRNKSSIFISYNEHRKGMMSSDDKYLFVSMSNPRNKHDIAKIDVEASEFTFLIDEYGNSDNQIDFNLFDAESNRFVTLSVRNTTNYFLQLRAVDSLKLIHEYQLKFNFTALEYKFVGNTEWGLTFALAVRTNPSYYDLQNDSKLFLYSVEGDKIVSANIAAPSVTFSTLQACYTYIISYKARFPTIKVYHYSNLSLATQIETLTSYENGINVERNIFILSDYDSHVVFDLKQSFSNKGWFYKFYSGLKLSILSQIFPKRGLLYDSPIETFYTLEKMIAYNISSPPVTSGIAKGTQSNCGSSKYYIPPEGSSSPECNYLLSLEFQNAAPPKKVELVKYSECLKTRQSHPIEAFHQVIFGKILISTDKKYILIFVCELASSNCLIEARPFADLGLTIYRETRIFQRDTYQVNFDLVSDQMLLIHTLNFIEAKIIDSAKNKAIFRHLKTIYRHFQQPRNDGIDNIQIIIHIVFNYIASINKLISVIMTKGHSLR